MMSVKTPPRDDFMEEFERDRAKARERNTTAPFIFRLNPGEKAVVRLLLNFDQQVRLDYHERFNQATQRTDVRAVCAAEFNQECQYCLDAKTNKDWKLKPRRTAFLPIFVHSVKKKNAETGAVELVTYTEDGETKPLRGERMLAMKLSSSTILDDLAAQFQEDSENPAERDITRFDFTIARNGKGLETKYTVSVNSRALPLPEGLHEWTPETVVAEVALKQPAKVVGDGSEADGAEDDMSDPEW